MTAAAVRPDRIGPVKELPRGHYSLTDLVRSEWIKLRTLHSTVWAFVITIVVGLGVSGVASAVTQAKWNTFPLETRLTFNATRLSIVGTFFGQLVIGVLGVLVMSAEYGSGTIRATLAAAPRRSGVLLAKVLVFGSLTLAAAELLSFGSFFLGQALLTPPATHATLATPDALRSVAGTGLYLFVMGLFALGLAAIIRHSAGAISAFVGLVLVLPIVVAALPSSMANSVNRYLPLVIGQNFENVQAIPNSFSPWVGLLVLCGYTVAILAIGCALLVRRDA